MSEEPKALVQWVRKIVDRGFAQHLHDIMLECKNIKNEMDEWTLSCLGYVIKVGDGWSITKLRRATTEQLEIITEQLQSITGQLKSYFLLT